MGDSFVHLHVHTEYSMLDGAARLKDMFAEANRLGMPAVAITDHGNMHGAYDFYKQAKAAGVTPIIGVEAYVAPESRLSQGAGQVGPPGAEERRRLRQRRVHPQDHVGAQRAPACRTCSGSTRAPRSRGTTSSGPGWTWSSSPSTPRGIMATTGCPSGEVQTRLRLGQFDEALEGRREVPGDLRQGELLPGDHGPRPRHRAAGSATACIEIGQQAGHPAAGHQRLALHPRGAGRGARRAAVRADRQQRRRPQPVPVRRHRLLPQVRRRDARGRLLRRCGRRAAATPCWWPSRSTPTGMFDVHAT